MIIEVEAWTAPMMSMYFIHADHLNTPRLITNHLGQAVWSWANDDPFGHNAPNEDPGGLGAFTCNLRLPGKSSMPKPASTTTTSEITIRASAGPSRAIPPVCMAG